jgi:IS605 OrfB family transposase
MDTLTAGRRPSWYDPMRTEHLARCLPGAATNDGVAVTHLSSTTRAGWIRAWVTADASIERPPRDLCVTEQPRKTREEVVANLKDTRRRKRQKLALAKKNKDAPRRTFALRLDPTKEQKLYFQRAITVSCLAKKLAYKHLGDQRESMTPDRMKGLRTRICSEMAPELISTRGEVFKTKRGRKAARKPGQDDGRNEFLPLSTWHRLFEHKLQEKNARMKEIGTAKRMNRSRSKPSARGTRKKPRTAWTTPLGRHPVHSDVRRNAALAFCKAVNATKAQMEEKAVEWDEKMEAHRRWLDRDKRVDQEMALAQASGEKLTKAGSRKRVHSKLPEKEKKLPTRKTPPKGDRPAMKPRQVKPPDRNAASHSFHIDATPGKANEFSVRWDVGGDNKIVRFMGLNVPLWGCPSKRRREIDRLTNRLSADEQNGSRQQTTLRYDRGRYHLLVQCFFVEPRKRSMDPSRPVNVVAFDPGIRTFLTGYDTRGRFLSVGDGQLERVIRVAKRVDKVKSKMATKLRDKDQRDHNSAKRKRARRRLRQLNAKCRDLKVDAHWKVARALCTEYDDVIIPKFHCSTMMRFLARSSTRQLMHWGHYEFRQRLQHKAQELGVRVHTVKEPYTSVTCSGCLWIEESFCGNSSKVFHCDKCGLTIDRDENAGRNIMLVHSRTRARHRIVNREI